jgi:hypothetical protein
MVVSIAERAEKIAVPDGFPGFTQDVTGGHVKRLAGQDVAARLDTD